MKRNRLFFVKMIASVACIFSSYIQLSCQIENIESIMLKSELALKNAHSLQFNCNRKSKFLGKSDTTSLWVKVSMEKIKDDSIGKAEFEIEYYNPDNLQTKLRVICDGRKLLNLNFNNKKGDFLNYDLDYVSLSKHNFDPQFLPEFLYKSENNIALINRAYRENKDDMSDNTIEDLDSAYKIKFPIKDDSSGVAPRFNAYWEFYIRKSDYFPVRYISYTETFLLKVRQFQLFDYTFRNIVINPHIPDSTFDIAGIYEKASSEFEIHDTKPKIQNFLDSMSIAPNFKLATATGDSILLSSLKGKVVFVDFWYRACYGCLKAIPDLEKLLGDFKDKDLAILGINVRKEETEFINKYKEKFGIKYTICVNGDRVAKDYLASAYPTFYLIDKTGRIRFSQAGWSEEFYENLRDKIEMLLREE